jgi:hypothetical protein
VVFDAVSLREACREEPEKGKKEGGGARTGTRVGVGLLGEAL